MTILVNESILIMVIALKLVFFLCDVNNYNLRIVYNNSRKKGVRQMFELKTNLIPVQLTVIKPNYPCYCTKI